MHVQRPAPSLEEDRKISLDLTERRDGEKEMSRHVQDMKTDM
jgi:hypothetical protein